MGTAEAANVSYCNYSVYHDEYCPDEEGSAHPRHTYYFNSGNSTGACIYMESWMYKAYTNSIASNPKYTAAGGCGSVTDTFVNNTELLRPYLWHDESGWYTLLGSATY